MGQVDDALKRINDARDILMGVKMPNPAKVFDEELPLGLELKNPLNIKENPNPDDPWVGQVRVDHRGHVEFEAVRYSYRAGLRTIWKMASLGHNTVPRMLAQWAPVDDPDPHARNNPSAYTEYICRKTGMSRNQKLLTLFWPNRSVRRRYALKTLLYHMSVYECGHGHFSMQSMGREIEEGIEEYDESFTRK